MNIRYIYVTGFWKYLPTDAELSVRNGVIAMIRNICDEVRVVGYGSLLEICRKIA